MLLYAWWFWLFLALLLFWFLGAYNRMVKLRASACQSYFTLETLLMKYQDLVQEAITAAATAPYGWRSAVTPEMGASHWTRLQVAASHCAMAVARMHEHPLLVSSALELIACESELKSAWQELTHPDVYYVSVPDELKQRWQELGVLTQPDMERFNQAIVDYNAAISQVPANFLAKTFQFEPAHILQ